MQNSAIKNRDYFFDNLRLLLIFTVVLCHGIELVRKYSAPIIAIHESILCFVMPLFVFTTGYFSKNIAIEGSPKRLRILNFALLYAISQPIKMYFEGSYSFLKPSYANWYLVALIAWFLILPLAARFKANVVFVFSIICALLIGLDPNANRILQVSRIVCFFPFFFLGFWCTPEIVLRLEAKSVRKFEFLILLGISSFCLVYWSDWAPVRLLHGNTSYTAMGLSPMLGLLMRSIWYVIVFLMCFGIFSIVPRKKYFFSILGTRTLPIYIIHTIVYAYIRTSTTFFQDIGKDNYTFIKIFIISLGVTLICANKWFANFFNYLMGISFKPFLRNTDSEISP